MLRFQKETVSRKYTHTWVQMEPSGKQTGVCVCLCVYFVTMEHEF